MGKTSQHALGQGIIYVPTYLLVFYIVFYNSLHTCCYTVWLIAPNKYGVHYQTLSINVLKLRTQDNQSPIVGPCGFEFKLPHKGDAALISLEKV